MSVQTILMKWALESNDYYMAYILYTEYNTGIPNSLLYRCLPSKKVFGSITDFTDSCDIKYTKDGYLNKIFVLFKSSTYKRLSDWDNNYGYSLN